MIPYFFSPFDIIEDFAKASSNSTTSRVIGMISTVASTCLTVKYTLVPLGPFISFTTSSIRIPEISTGSSFSWATFIIISSTSSNLSRQTGPPEITSTILIC